MDTFSMIGFFVVMFATAIGAVVLLICAGYGAVHLKRQWENGVRWQTTEQDVTGAFKS